jgi:hypothetical protein
VSAACYCHCESCRRAAGAHAIAWATVRRDGFRFTRGRAHEFASSPGVTRTFCEGCGASLTYQNVDDPETLDLTVATLDTPNVVAPVDHVWMQDAPAWDRPCDGLPMFRTSRAAGEPFTSESR